MNTNYASLLCFVIAKVVRVVWVCSSMLRRKLNYPSYAIVNQAHVRRVSNDYLYICCRRQRGNPESKVFISNPIFEACIQRCIAVYFHQPTGQIWLCYYGRPFGIYSVTDELRSSVAVSSNAWFFIGSETALTHNMADYRLLMGVRKRWQIPNGYR
jgi:hypothetical protein